MAAPVIANPNVADRHLSLMWVAPIGVGTVVAVITYASLIMGELVPKQIALRDPEAVAVRVAPFLTLLAKISAPAVFASPSSQRPAPGRSSRRQARSCAKRSKTSSGRSMSKTLSW